MPLPDPVETPLLRPADLRTLIPDKGRSAIYEAIRRGDIPSVRIGGSVYIPTGELRRLWGVDPPAVESAPTGALDCPGNAA